MKNALLLLAVATCAASVSAEDALKLLGAMEGNGAQAVKL